MLQNKVHRPSGISDVGRVAIASAQSTGNLVTPLHRLSRVNAATDTQEMG